MREFIFRDEPIGEDVEHVASILRSTRFFSDEEESIGVELIQQRLKEGVVSGYNFIFAELNKKVVGFSCFGKIPATYDGFDLYWIAIDPFYQKEGLGWQLLQLTEKRVKEEKGGRLYVETSGIETYFPTRTFYEHHGFVLEACQRDYYGPNDDRMLYVKQLN